MMVFNGTGVTLDGNLDTKSLKINGSTVNSSADDINKLHNLSTTKTELGYIHGLESAVQTQINSKLDITDASNTYAPKTGHADITTVGSLTAGSIGGNFGDINIGTNAINAGTLSVGEVVINSDTIGHKNNNSLLTLASNSLEINKPTTITGKLTASEINIDGTDLNTGAAAAINKMVSVNSTADELNLLHGISTNITTSNLNQLANVTYDIHIKFNDKLDASILVIMSLKEGNTSL